MVQLLEIIPHGRPRHLFNIVNTIVADGMVMQVAMPSEAMVLYSSSLNAAASTSEGLTHWPLENINKIFD